jgi:alternate signal-mediated exported protein
MAAQSPVTTDESQRRQRRLTGVVAGAAGIALLLGGTSYALWNDSGTVANNGTVTAGNLDLAVGTPQWYDVSADRTDQDDTTLSGDDGHKITDIAKYRIVPGDVLQNEATLGIALQGDNMVANLAINPGSFSAGTLTKLGLQYAVVALNAEGTAIDTEAANTTLGDDSTSAGGFVVPWTDFSPNSETDTVIATFAGKDDGNLENPVAADPSANGDGEADSDTTTTIKVATSDTSTETPNYAILIRASLPQDMNGSEVSDDGDQTEVKTTQALSNFTIKLIQVRADTGNFQASESED